MVEYTTQAEEAIGDACEGAINASRFTKHRVLSGLCAWQADKRPLVQNAEYPGRLQPWSD